MKAFVKLMTICAFTTIMLGGSMLDGNLPMATAVIAPGIVWFGLIAWANNRREE